MTLYPAACIKHPRTKITTKKYSCRSNWANLRPAGRVLSQIPAQNNEGEPSDFAQAPSKHVCPPKQCQQDIGTWPAAFSGLTKYSPENELQSAARYARSKNKEVFEELNP